MQGKSDWWSEVAHYVLLQNTLVMYGTDLMISWNVKSVYMME